MILLVALVKTVYDEDISLLATHEVHEEPFTHFVSGRCELRSFDEHTVFVPETPNNLHMRLKLVELVEEGTQVKKDHHLATIDTTELEQIIRQLRSDIKVAQAGQSAAEKFFAIEESRLKAEVEKAQVVLREKRVALRKAQLTPGSMKKLEASLALEKEQQLVTHKKEQLESFQYLAKSQVASEFDLRQKRLEYLKAMAAAKQKELEFEILKQGGDPIELSRLENDVAKAEIDLQQAENNLQYQLPALRADVDKAKQGVFYPQKYLTKAEGFMKKAKILSPADGMVLYQRVWGASGKEKVKKGIRLWGGDSFLSIQNMEKMQVNVEIPEGEINAIAVGQKAIVEIDSVKGESFSARVVEVGTLAREKGESSGIDEKKEERETNDEKVFEVVVKLDQRDPRLKPGLTGTVKIVVEKWDKAIVIPSRAVFQKDSQHYVYIADNRTPEQRLLKVQKVLADQVVIGQGLADGEQIFLGNPWEVEVEKNRLVDIAGKKFEVVGKVAKGKFSHTLAETGSLIPRQMEVLHAQISGELTYLAPEGSYVEKGEKVFAVEKSEENQFLKEVIMQQQSLEADVKKRQQELQLAEKNQQLEMKRVEIEVQMAQFELDTLQSQPLPREVKKARIEREQAHLAYEIAIESLQLGEALFLKTLISEVELGQRRLEGEKSKSQLEVSRLKEKILLEGPSAEKIEIAREKLRLAQVKYAQAKKAALSNIEKHRAILKVAETQLAQKNYELEFAESTIKDGVVYAPNSGKVLYYKSRWRGKPQVGKEVHSGQAIATISGEQEMLVKTKVNEVDRYLVQQGQRSRVTLPALPGKEFSGEVVSVSQLAMDRSENAESFISKKFSGVMVFEVQVQILEKSPLLRAGMSAVAEIFVEEHQDMVMVPKRAILQEEGTGHYIFLLQQGEVVKTKVQVESSNHSHVAISSAIPSGTVVCIPRKAVMDKRTH